MGAKNYLFLREGEWPHELRLPKVVPTVLFDSMYMGFEIGGQGAVVPFEIYALASVNLYV